MQLSASARSFRSASGDESGEEGKSLPSLFQRQLLCEPEEVVVDIPKGVPAEHSQSASTWCSRRRARLRNRRYFVTVEPNPDFRQPMPQPSQLVPSTRLPPLSADEHLGEKPSFRQERAGKFHTGRHFPALVASPQLLPTWRRANKAAAKAAAKAQTARPHYNAPEDEAEVPFMKPTESAARKLRDKKLDVGARTFVCTAPTSARDLLCDRGPALHADPYDLALAEERERAKQTKESLRGAPTVLTSIASARSSCDSFRPRLDDHIAEMRHRGRAMNASLKERYQQRLKAFREEHSVYDTNAFERAKASWREQEDMFAVQQEAAAEEVKSQPKAVFMWPRAGKGATHTGGLSSVHV
jgi:hypothetical protein